MPEECPQGVADLVAACLAEDAAERPSAADIVSLLEGDPAVLEARRLKRFKIGAATQPHDAVSAELYISFPNYELLSYEHSLMDARATRCSKFTAAPPKSLQVGRRSG